MTQEEKIWCLEQKIMNLERQVQMLNGEDKKPDSNPVRSSDSTDREPAHPAPEHTVHKTPKPEPEEAHREPRFDIRATAEDYRKSQLTTPDTGAVPHTPHPHQKPTQTASPAPSHSRPKPKADTESFIGKNVFAIVASVLIFIGVVFFARALMPYLTDGAKFIIMCVASLSFAAFGYWLVQRKENTLTIAVLACGLGTIYISLFTGMLYFKFLHVFVLYGLLMLWILAVYHCSKYMTVLFNLIGQLGILFSLFLCMFDAYTKKDPKLIFFLLIYVVVAEILYDILYKDDRYMINMTSAMASIAIMAYPVIHEINLNAASFDQLVTKVTLESLSLDGRLLSLLLLIFLFGYETINLVTLKRREDIDEARYTIMAGISLMVFGSSMLGFSPSSLLYVIICFYCVFMFIVTERLFYDSKREIVTALSCIYFAACIVSYQMIYEYCWPAGSAEEGHILIPALAFIVPLALYFHYTDTTLSKALLPICTVAATGINFFYVSGSSPNFIIGYARGIKGNGYMDNIESAISAVNITYFIVLLMLTCILYYYLRGCLEKYAEDALWGKMLLYVFVVINTVYSFYQMSFFSKYRFDVFFGRPADECRELIRHLLDTRTLLTLLFIVCIQLVFSHNGLYDRDTDAFNQGTFIGFSLVNVMAMLYAWFCLYSLDESVFEYILACILATVLFSINVTLFLKKEDTPGAIYIGIKMTVLIFIMMHVVKLQPLVSILMFAWAIVCIALGFRHQQKYLRIYALILSLVSAGKLVLIDISYDSSLMRAASFMICGALCFVISYIYHRLETANIITGEE